MTTLSPCRMIRCRTRARCRLPALPALWVSLVLLALLALKASTDAVAAPRVLRDPTRPLAVTSAHPAAAPAPSATAAPPTAPATAPPAPPLVLPRLQMVLTASDRRYAVIDGELLAEGEIIQGIRVLKINGDAVIVTTPNGSRTLPLPADIE